MDIIDKEIKQFQETIQKHSEYDLSGYSRNSLRRRLIKVLDNYNSFDHLLQTISHNAEALENTIKRITVNTTEMFRDPVLWQNFILNILPSYKDLPTINIWHPGCSTGQEVYSMMMILDQFNLLEKTNIYASDINTDVLDIAKKGEYRLRFNKEYIENYKQVFNKEISEKTGITFSSFEKYMKVDEIRDLIIMKNFLKEKPVYRKSDLVKNDNLFYLNFDLIVCRNVIIYFNFELQNKVLKLFHRNMNDNACLFLGIHESIIGPCSSLFEKNDHFYFKTERK